MSVLVTGAAGFIGMHVAHALLQRGERVIGLDHFNDYYAVSLKEARAALLATWPNFRMMRLDVADHSAMEGFFASIPEITGIVHLAAQAGVRHSLHHPYAYIRANILGHTVMLEGARRLPKLRRFVYASSSSVYGNATVPPFSEDDRADQPVSLYAASKRADELITNSYSHLYGLSAIGLRFFTVYGPWGRPDMAPMLFAKAIMADQPIDVFNHGDMQRDFTYIDDIVAGTLAALDRNIPALDAACPPHRIYNLGHHQPERLLDFIAYLEEALGRTARKNFLPMQPGDVPATCASLDRAATELGFVPTTNLKDGITRFADWYRTYYGLKAPSL
jgi:UDP-glucuronate 4-epimerase